MRWVKRYGLNTAALQCDSMIYSTNIYKVHYAIIPHANRIFLLLLIRDEGTLDWIWYELTPLTPQVYILVLPFADLKTLI